MKSKEYRGRGRLLSLLGPLLAFAMCFVFPVLSAPPAWWSNYGVLNGNAPNDFGAANQGQAKNVAVAAVSELDNDLAQFGGAGPTLDQLAQTLSGTTPQTSDYSAVNLGMLKWLSKPFFDRLLSLGYDGAPLTSGTYPWAAPGAGTPNDYAMGNIGQLKYLFSFDVTYSSTGDSVPDWWKQLYFPGQPVTSSSSTLWSGGRVTLLQAYQQGLNPIDFYNGQTPTLTIISGNNQTGAPGGFAPSALIVSVSNQGSPMVNAPVTFTVTSGGGGLKTSYMAGPVNSVSLLTNQNGQALIYFQLPAVNSNTSTITAAAGSTGAQAQQLFSESTDNGAGTTTCSSPFAPTNGSTVRNIDGSLDLSWQNNTDDPSPIPISLQQADGSWKVITTVPAGTTHVHIPAP